MNIKINLKSILKFEQFSNKSFNTIDYQNPDDMLILMYCCILENNSERFTFEEFKEMIKSNKIAKEISLKFNSELSIIEQFSKYKQQIKTENETDSNEIIEHPYIKEYITLLIINAELNPDFVLNELSVNDIEIYVIAFNEKMKREQENNRLWCFMSVLPHLGDNKINTPEKYFPFPWDRQIKEIEKDNKINENEFNDLMASSIEIINKIKQIN